MTSLGWIGERFGLKTQNACAQRCRELTSNFQGALNTTERAHSKPYEFQEVIARDTIGQEDDHLFLHCPGTRYDT